MMNSVEEMQKRIEQLELQLAESLELCEELGYDKARYFRLYEMACIELHSVKKQQCVAEIKVSCSDIDGEVVEVLFCELGEGTHKVYNGLGDVKVEDHDSHVLTYLCQLQATV